MFVFDNVSPPAYSEDRRVYNRARLGQKHVFVMRLPRCYVVLVQNVDCQETAERKRETVAVALMLF